jgi:hypothetical protein
VRDHHSHLAPTTGCYLYLPPSWTRNHDSLIATPWWTHPCPPTPVISPVATTSASFDGLESSTIVVENATLSTQLVPKAHHMSTGKRVGQQVDGVVPSHVPNYVLVGEDMGQNPKKLGKDIQVGVACKSDDSIDGSNRQRPPLKVRSKCPT